MSPDDDRARADETLLSQPPEEPGRQPEPQPTAPKKEGFLSRRFEPTVAILIAIVTVAGAFVTWRASTLGGNAADAERQGVLSAISRERVQTDNRTRLYNELRTFTTYVEHQEMVSVLEQDALKLAEEMGEEEQVESLLREADTYEELAASTYRFLDYPQYVIEDDEGRKTYDAEGYMQASLDIDARAQDLNPGDDFREADRLHVQAQWLVGVVIVLAVALLFFTLAEITRSSLRYIFVAVGLFTFLAAVVIGAIIEITALL